MHRGKFWWRWALAVALVPPAAPRANADAWARAMPPVRVFNDRDGLPQNSIIALHLDPGGPLYVGTHDGLVRYDGRALLPVSLPEGAGNLQAVVSTPEGLVVGSGNGLHVRGPGGAWTTRREADGLPSDAVTWLLYERDGPLSGLWIGTEKGLSRLHDGRLAVISVAGVSGTFVRWLGAGTLAGARQLLVGGTGGISAFDGSRWRHFGTSEGLPELDVWSVADVPWDGKPALVAGMQRSLARFDGARWQKIATPGFPDLGAAFVGSSRHLPGETLLGSWGHGLIRRKQGAFSAWTTKEGLPNDFAGRFLDGPESVIFVGTDGGGFAQLRLGAFRALGTAAGLPDRFTSALAVSTAADGTASLWVGTDGGLVRFAGDRVERWPSDGGVHGGISRVVVDERPGEVRAWVGTWGQGLFLVVNGKTVRHWDLASGLPNLQVTALHLDRDAAGNPSVIAGGDAGLARLVGNRFERLVVEPFPDAPIWTLLSTAIPGSGRALWVAAGKGLARLADGVWHVETGDGFPGGDVNALRVFSRPDGRRELWVATSNGAAFRSLEGGRWNTLSSTTTPALPGDAVRSLEQDRQGRVYLFTTRGVARLDRATSGTVSIETFSFEDGMPSLEVGADASLVDGEGRIWAGTVAGTAVFDPREELPAGGAKPLHVDRVLVEGLERTLPLPALSHRESDLAFEFSLVSFVRNGEARFRTQLLGYEAAPSAWQKEARREYTNVPAGRRTFAVWGRDHAGNVTGPVTVDFVVKPAPWLTWWAFAGYAVAMAAAGSTAARMRLRVLRRRNEELESLVAERTRDLQQANEKITRLLESSPGAEGVPEWSRAVAQEIAAAIGARAIGIWEVDGESVTPVSDSGLRPPSRAELGGLLKAAGENLVEAGEGTIVPVTGMSGDLCGALVVQGDDIAWGDTERHLVAGFARQLGAVLDMGKIRRRLAVAEERRAATRREMHENGIATLQICPKCHRCFDHTAGPCPDDGSSLDAPRPLPYRLVGRYRFEMRLNQGGMGVVFSAQDEKLGRQVAVKLIRPEHWSDVDLKQRFEREAHAIARIQHPGVINLYDSGELDDGTAFLVMEMLAGCDLRLLLSSYGRGKPAQVASLIRQGCAALKAAHRSGVIHRDVKPENVFLVDDAAGFRVKVLDFGLAKSLKFEKGLTQAGTILGTPTYMAPEQVQSEDVDTRADVYSFAAVAYEALTGRAAIQGNDLAIVLMHVLNTVPPPVSSLVPGVPPEVDEAFASALAKDPARRLKDIELWGSSLVEFLEKTPPDAATRGWPVTRNGFRQIQESRIDTL